MKVVFILLACVAYVAASGYIYPKPKEPKYADKAFLEKQKFLFEIVYRLEDPLFFEEYIKYGGNLIFDKAYYTQFDDYMYKFYEAYKYGGLLPKGEYFSALVKTHIQQVYGLFKYFYFAKDWETFKHNVCWARIHVNEGMFFYALNLAVIHHPEFNGLILPAVYEVFPQYFYNNKFIYQAEKFDYEVYSKYAQYEKQYKDIYYKDAKDMYGNYYYQHDWKTWQWWKMFGLDEHFYYEDKYILRENYEQFYKDSVHADFFKQFKSFYMPVDYTRDVDFYNYHYDLSYFTEDIGWNSYWYYLNLDYPVFFEGKTYGLNKDRRGEYYIYNVQQLLARYYCERLSHGYGEIEDFSFYNYVQTGYDPHLITYNGVAYSYRPNYYYVYSYENYGNYEMYQRMIDTFSRIYDIIDTGYYKTYDGTVIDMRKPESYEYIGNLLHGNYDVFDKHFFTYWTVFAHMYFGEVDYTDKYVYPNTFLNYETMLRDPFFYMFYKKVADVFYRFAYHLGAYTQKDLYFEGVKIEDVKVDKLVTYFDFYDADVTNLLNDKPTFKDGKFVWDQQLLARQLRLNHKPFYYDITINADKAYKAVVKAFIGPKFDEFGHTIPFYENYQNFYEFDEFYYQLAPGKNVIKRNSFDFYWTVKDKTTYTELYYYTMYAYEGKYKFPYDIAEPHNGFPDRLILPHGSVDGCYYQMFFFVYPYSAQYEQFSNYDYSYYHGVGTGTRYIDNKPFAYPLDRPVDEFAYYVPNMYFKDVKVYHEEQYEKYYENYDNYGHFDYNYYHY